MPEKYPRKNTCFFGCFYGGQKSGFSTLVCTPVRALILRILKQSIGMESNEHLRDKHINISEAREVVYWAYVLQCEQEDLINAVMKIGTSAKMVDDFLFLNRLKNPRRE